MDPEDLLFLKWPVELRNPIIVRCHYSVLIFMISQEDNRNSKERHVEYIAPLGHIILEHIQVKSDSRTKEAGLKREPIPSQKERHADCIQE